MSAYDITGFFRKLRTASWPTAYRLNPHLNTAYQNSVWGEITNYQEVKTLKQVCLYLKYINFSYIVMCFDL